MNLFIKHILRNMEDNIWRTILIVFACFVIGLFISIELFASIFMVKYVYSMIDTYTAKSVNYVIQGDVLDKFDYEILENYDLDLKYLGINITDSGSIYSDNGKYTSVYLSTTDINSAKEFGVYDEDYELADDEIAVSWDAATSLGLTKDETFEYINSAGEKYKLKVKYVTKELNDLDKIGLSIILSNENTYHKICNQLENDNFMIALAKYKENANIKETKEKIENIELSTSTTFINVGDTAEEIIEILAGEKEIKLIAFLVIIAAIIIYFGVSSIIKIIVQERVTVIGTFRSLGASNLTTCLILLGEIGMYGFFGGLLGSVAGTGLLGTVFVQLTYSLYNSVTELVLSYVFVILGTSLVLALFQIILGLSEIIEVNHLSIKDILLSKRESRYHYSFTKTVLGTVFFIITISSFILSYRVSYWFAVIALICLFGSLSIFVPILCKFINNLIKNKPPLLKMAFDTVSDNKLQVDVTVITSIMLSISVVVLCFFSAYITSIEESVSIINSDMYVFTEEEPITAYEEIEAIPGIKTINSIYMEELGYNKILLGGEKISQFNVYFAYTDNPLLLKDSDKLVDTDYDVWNNLNNDEVIISNYYKDKYNIKINDIITISLVSNASDLNKYNDFEYSVDYNLKVVGFADTTNLEEKTFIVPKKVFDEQKSNIVDGTFTIMLEENADADNIKTSIQDILVNSESSVYTNKEYKSLQITQIKMYQKIIYIVVAVIIAISLVGIFNNQTVSVMQRSKEFAILYSTCMTRKQIASMILKEYTISYIISWIVSLIFGLILCNLTYIALDSIGYSLTYDVVVLKIFLLYIVVAAILLIIYVFARRKIKKLDVMEELKYE